MAERATSGEGGTREPFFLRAGSLLSPGNVDVPITGADLYPTLLSLTDLNTEVTQEFDGTDITEVAKRHNLPERALFWHYPHYGNQGGDPSSEVRRGDWKLIHYWEDGTEELYNLAADPQEQTDLATAEPERVAELSTLLLDFLTARNARYPTPDPEYRRADFNRKAAEYRDRLLPRLEKERVEMFREDWQPNGDWWGSE